MTEDALQLKDIAAIAQKLHGERVPESMRVHVIDAGIAKRDAASEYLRELEHIGVLQSKKRGREVLYRHPALLEVLKA